MHISLNGTGYSKSVSNVYVRYEEVCVQCVKLWICMYIYVQNKCQI